ncbi:Aste57867_8289 [Aphanomyces stellatus]|uniref:non-specific serine/threonine protein kinase n=1 Tax=Aphanomyces stellatus TaxID=120398 RepID=A0A485KJV0_9STRA|nr:hypothetical protein As57867_008258 [Aphanomyces stellatus]VFT85176.1 Aste57867_8289 [Aphanomyces stellatus]
MDKYRKLERIGKGSFGSAYLAEKRGEPGKRYVIKEVQIDPRDQKAAVREARLLAALDHPNIIACKEHFLVPPSNKVFCIVTEYADGGDLRKLLKQYEAAGRRLTEAQVLDLLVQICLALKHVHDRKILHRDIKPENIFLMQSRIVKLGDFGVAKVLSNTMACADTQTGTPYYTSPEICHGLQYNHKTDVWSLGCVVYEMITQSHAFDGRNQKQLFQNIAYGAYDTSRLDGSSASLTQLVTSMLAKAPRERPSINAILRTPIVRDRIQTFLSAREMQEELNHTVLHGQHLFRKPKAAATSPRAMKHPPPPLVGKPVVKPVVKERQPVAVRGYQAPTAAAKQRAEVMAAKKERVQALVARQRELAEMRLLQEKKARLAKKQAEVERRKEQLRQKSPPKVRRLQGDSDKHDTQSAPEAAAAVQMKAEAAKRQQLLDQQAVRDLPTVPRVQAKHGRLQEREMERLKMADDIRERKKLMRGNKPSDEPVILVQAIKPEGVVTQLMPKVEAIIAPDSIYFDSTVGSPTHVTGAWGFDAPRPSSPPIAEEGSESGEPSVTDIDGNAGGDLPPPPAPLVIDTDVEDIECDNGDVVLNHAKPNLEYERMVLQMKSVMEAGDDATAVDEEDPTADDDDQDDENVSPADVRLSQLAFLQGAAFKAALKAMWHNPLKPEEVRGAEGTTAASPPLSPRRLDDARWLCAYLQDVVGT